MDFRRKMGPKRESFAGGKMLAGPAGSEIMAGVSPVATGDSPPAILLRRKR